MGSSSHLPPYCSQPDPYPPPSPAQQARCLISTKRFPAGEGVGGGDKGWRRSRGSSAARPFDLLPGPAGPTAQTDSPVFAPCLLLHLLSLLLSATQTPGADGERRGGGGWRRGAVSTMRGLTRTTLTSRPSPPPQFIFGCGSLNSLQAGCAPPSLVYFLLYPSAASNHVWPSMPLLAIKTCSLSNMPFMV